MRPEHFCKRVWRRGDPLYLCTESDRGRQVRCNFWIQGRFQDQSWCRYNYNGYDPDEVTNRCFSEEARKVVRDGG